MEENDIRNITIIGNQHLSRAIIQGLVTNKKYNLTLITSRHQRPYLPNNIDVSNVAHGTTDFSEQSLHETLAGQDLVISTLPPGDIDLQKRVVDASIAVGARGFIANEFGLDSQNAEIQHRLPSYRARNRLVQYLRDAEDRLEWVAAAVGTVLDHELLNGKLGFDLKWHSASIPGSERTRFPATSLRRVGELVAAIVRRWGQVKNSYLYAHGCVTTAGEVVKCLERETSTDWVVDYSEPKEVLRSAEMMLQAGWPDAGWTLIERTVVFDRDAGGAKNFLEGSVSAKLGIEGEKIESIIRNTIHEWNHTERGDCGCN